MVILIEPLIMGFNMYVHTMYCNFVFTRQVHSYHTISKAFINTKIINLLREVNTNLIKKRKVDLTLLNPLDAT